MDNKDTRNYYSIACDKNGNKVVRVKTSGRGGFSIQTNGNLPQTHRDGVTAETDAEVCAYVRRHGSERQKRILGIQFTPVSVGKILKGG